jgi:hypothetical protein
MTTTVEGARPSKEGAMQGGEERRAPSWHKQTQKAAVFFKSSRDVLSSRKPTQHLCSTGPFVPDRYLCHYKSNEQCKSPCVCNLMCSIWSFGVFRYSKKSIFSEHLHTRKKEWPWSSHGLTTALSWSICSVVMDEGLIDKKKEKVIEKTARHPKMKSSSYTFIQ